MSTTAVKKTKVKPPPKSQRQAWESSAMHTSMTFTWSPMQAATLGQRGSEVGLHLLRTMPGKNAPNYIAMTKMAFGDAALTKLEELVNGTGPLGMDIETSGLGPAELRQIKVVTLGNADLVVALDARNPEHRAALRRATDAIMNQKTGGQLNGKRPVLLHNCFSGDTRFVTRDGIRTLGECAGETVEVWSDGQWLKADAREYGVSAVQKVTVRPARYRSNVEHTFQATPNHRWPLADGRLAHTSDLRPGDIIEAARPTIDVDMASDAFKHGLIFADGSLTSHQPKADGVWGYQLRLCGDKAKWLHVFDHWTYPPSAKGDPVVTGKLPFNPTELPATPDAEYTAAFLEGWQQLDGSGRDGASVSREVTTTSAEAAQWLRDNAVLGGWFVTGHSSRTMSGGYSPGTTIHRVILSKGSESKPVEWRVKSISEPCEPQPVFCVEVPDVERFTLAEGVYTANCPFDIPLLTAAGMVDREFVESVCDTLVLQRMAEPGNNVSRKLSDLVKKHLRIDVSSAANWPHDMGVSKGDEWYALGDIDLPAYLRSAMLDTAVLPWLWDALYSTAYTLLTEQNPYPRVACDGPKATRLIWREQTVNRVMMRGTVHGFALDDAFRDDYVQSRKDEVSAASALLRSEGIRAGQGIDIVTKLEELGALPKTWARTDTGRLSADKEALTGLDAPEVIAMYSPSAWEGHELLPTDAEEGNNLSDSLDPDDCLSEFLRRQGKYMIIDDRLYPPDADPEDEKKWEKASQHPLHAAYRVEKDVTKMLDDYLSKLDAYAEMDGRVHPQVAVLGASCTGRMSASAPPVQQFPADARKMVLADDPGGWMSIDWSAVEPLTAAYAAGEHELARAITHEGDAYVPVAKLAGLIPMDLPLEEAKEHKGRKKAKVVLLGLLYGKGVPLLAEELKTDPDDAKEIKRAVLAGVPQIGAWMEALRDSAMDYVRTSTVSGRVIPISKDPRNGSVKGYLAQNYFHQGSAYDSLAEALLVCHQQGLAPYIRIAVHDELVVASAVWERVAQIMETAVSDMCTFTHRPPRFLWIKLDRSDPSVDPETECLPEKPWTWFRRVLNPVVDPSNPARQKAVEDKLITPDEEGLWLPTDSNPLPDRWLKV